MLKKLPKILEKKAKLIMILRKLMKNSEWCKVKQNAKNNFRKMANLMKMFKKESKLFQKVAKLKKLLKKLLKY